MATGIPAKLSEYREHGTVGQRMNAYEVMKIWPAMGRAFLCDGEGHVKGFRRILSLLPGIISLWVPNTNPHAETQKTVKSLS
jgi:hypothetical protein